MDVERKRGLLSSAALRAAKFALAALFGLALWLADDERAAANVGGGIELIVCQLRFSRELELRTPHCSAGSLSLKVISYHA